MRIGAMLLPAFCVVTLLLITGARADVTSCRDELQRMAQTYHLSISPTGPSAAAPSQPSQGATAEAPATTESRGMAAGSDSLASSGGTLPPSTSSVVPEARGGASETPQLGAADRAKAEGLLSEAQTADGQGKGDQCLQSLRDARAIMQKGRQ
jgi:hypothetical protein